MNGRVNDSGGVFSEYFDETANQVIVHTKMRFFLLMPQEGVYPQVSTSVSGKHGWIRTDVLQCFYILQNCSKRRKL